MIIDEIGSSSLGVVDVARAMVPFEQEIAQRWQNIPRHVWHEHSGAGAVPYSITGESDSASRSFHDSSQSELFSMEPSFFPACLVLFSRNFLLLYHY
jgi:hypothetical protein